MKIHLTSSTLLLLTQSVNARLELTSLFNKDSVAKEEHLYHSLQNNVYSARQNCQYDVNKSCSTRTSNVLKYYSAKMSSASYAGKSSSYGGAKPNRPVIAMYDGNRQKHDQHGYVHDMPHPVEKPEGRNVLPPLPKPDVHPHEGMNMHMTNWAQKPREDEDNGMDKPNNFDEILELTEPELTPYKVEDALEVPEAEPLVVYDGVNMIAPIKVDGGEDTLEVPEAEPLVVYDGVNMIAPINVDEGEDIPLEDEPLVVHETLVVHYSEEIVVEDNKEEGTYNNNERRNLRAVHHNGKNRHLHSKLHKVSHHHQFSMDKHFAPLGYNWKIEKCLRVHFSVYNDLSPKCYDSIHIADSSFDKLVAQQEANDHQEFIYRGAALLVSVLTMLASWMFTLLHKASDSSNSSNRMCLRLNQGFAVTMLGAVALYSPAFLLIIVPSFAVVQVANVCCYKGSDQEEASYEAVPQEHIAQPNEKVFTGVPVDL